MITQTIGNFAFYIYESDTEPPDMDPFSYSLVITTKDDEPFAGYGMCNGIPCQMCTLRDSCKDGESRTEAIVEYTKVSHPELLI